MNLKKTVCSFLPNLLKASLSGQFNFLYDFLRIKPYFVTIIISDNCCFNCVMCDQGKNKVLPELSTQEWMNILAQLKENGISEVVFSGGEPLLRKDIAELLFYAKKLKLTSGIMTNGYLLNKPFFDKLIAIGVDHISITIEGDEEGFDTTRGVKGAYSRVMDSCRLLSDYQRKRLVNGYLFFTLTKPSLYSYRVALKIAGELKFPLAINLFDSTPYFFKGQENKKGQFWIASNEDLKELKNLQRDLADEKAKRPKGIYHMYTEIDYFRKYFTDPLQRSMPCVASQERLGIDSVGNVYGGCWSGKSFGNLKDHSLKDIINSEGYKSAHKDMFFKKCPGCSCGYPKNLRYHLPTLMKEAAFRMFPSTRKNIWR